MTLKMKDLLDIIHNLKTPFLFCISFFARSMTLRISLVALISSLFLLLYSLGSNYQMQISTEAINKQIELVKYLHRQAQLLTGVEKVTLCLDAIKVKSKIEAWYCEDALRFYKSSQATIVESRKTEIIDRKAFGAMQLEFNSQQRIQEINWKIQEAKVRPDIWSLLFATHKGLIMLILTYLSILLSMVLLMQKAASKRRNWEENRITLQVPN